ncbi:MAG TPA: tol-pal system-associated acyl-CoA thioesterase [Burkholderiales bacterium]|nr:tol-pal system-associated acyl-CoA thioesterase [Burkholderiales bacterium]
MPPPPVPAAANFGGRIEIGFELPLRVYFQDTDAGGVVFHATYLHFLERARVEWLRAKGFGQAELAQRFKLVFMVRQLEVAYVKPAVLDDLVTVTAEVGKMGRAQLTFLQEVRRGGETLLRASVNVACVATETFKPMAIPEELRASLDGDMNLRAQVA